MNAVLNVRAGVRRDIAVAGGARWSAAVAGRSGTLAVPEPFQAWAGTGPCAADEIREGGYPVLGDLERIVPRSEGLSSGPARRRAARGAGRVPAPAVALRKAEQR